MNTRISATVYRDDMACKCGAEWTAAVTVSSNGALSKRVIVYRKSWPETMQAAYALMASIDADLMDEVHASRASRRAAPFRNASPPRNCTCPSGDGSLRWPCPAHPPCPGSCDCAECAAVLAQFTTTDPHTMEPTA